MNELKCKYCDKVIEGYNENHVEFLMKQHVFHKHKDKTKLKKEKKNEPLQNN